MTEGTLGPFGWLGGPNATMWPELLAAGAFGGYVAARRQWLAAERDRAARAAQLREEETRRRVDAERMRIARELHDVVAHSMAMINVQATAAAMLLPRTQTAPPPRSRRSAAPASRACASCGRSSTCCGEADGDGPAVPVPGLRDIQALADATSAAGTHARCGWTVTRICPVPPPVALAAYRIVQESLTNVVRHAGGVAATVSVRHEGGDLLVDVIRANAAATRRWVRGGAGRDGAFRAAPGRPGRDARARGGPRRRPDGRPAAGGRVRRPGHGSRSAARRATR